MADSVSGRVATSPFLTSAPIGLPALAPRMLAAGTLSGAAAVQVVRRAPAAAPSRAPKRLRAAPAVNGPRAQLSPKRLARIQLIEQRRGAQEARQAAKRVEQQSRREAQRAQAEARRAGRPKSR